MYLKLASNRVLIRYERLFIHTQAVWCEERILYFCSSYNSSLQIDLNNATRTDYCKNVTLYLIRGDQVIFWVYHMSCSTRLRTWKENEFW